MTSALLVIDVQNSFLQLPDWQHTSRPDIVPQVDRLATAARNAGDTVIWVLGSRPGTGTVFDPAQGHVRLMDGLHPHPGEPTLTKTAHNAFTTTNLHQLLTQRGTTKLTICGIRTEQCCETTARLYKVDHCPGGPGVRLYPTELRRHHPRSRFAPGRSRSPRH
uniref:cysteine hydrolase family protein n=1 Tax=Nonomuraea sp. SBT364 TaxID=1580530 RepID=UPI000B2629B2